MPKRKTADLDLTVPAEPKKKRVAAKTSPATPTHKHTAKKTVEPVAEPVRTATREDIARLAYSYWEQRDFQPGSPEEDWFRAEKELLKLA